jgi:hypothetical protein
MQTSIRLCGMSFKLVPYPLRALQHYETEEGVM